MSDLSSRTVVVTGATGPAGTAVVRRLRAAGATVVAAGRTDSRLAALAAATRTEAATQKAPELVTQVVDLGDETATRAWAARIRERRQVDGVIHLVGGWRGGTRFADASMADAEWLHDQVVRTTQHVSLAFHDELVASPAGRFVIVSAAAVTAPTPGSAAYASVKAAAETWTQAMASSFVECQHDERSPDSLRAAAMIFVVQMLVDPAMRTAEPDRSFSDGTDVEVLARAVEGLWSSSAETINGARIELLP